MVGLEVDCREAANRIGVTVLAPRLTELVPGRSRRWGWNSFRLGKTDCGNPSADQVADDGFDHRHRGHRVRPAAVGFLQAVALV